MIIEIYDSQTLNEISALFSNIYPFLKIEFYKKPHMWQEESSIADKLDHDLTVAEVSKKKNHIGYMEIHFWQKTGVVERYLKNRFGLHTQIFRLQGDEWIQTVGTDELTLEEQNEIGRNATYNFMHGNDLQLEKGKYL